MSLYEKMKVAMSPHFGGVRPRHVSILGNEFKCQEDDGCHFLEGVIIFVTNRSKARQNKHKNISGKSSN